ncbi:MAG: hypothetical protein JW809_06850 [Pirellulales bacterium]|nr:hypothetical protein [Pirellulales bacterium]
MTSRRVIPGVLHNFLGTFTSRYSDLDGYWVFGFLVDSMDTVRFDLLGEVAESADSTPSGFARRLAAQKFSEQIHKAGLSRERFREAYLDISKSALSKIGVINGQTCSGHDVRFQAHVVTDLGRAYDSTASIFVAPHDPKIESRSARAV